MKNSKIGTGRRRRFQFAAYCRELRAPEDSYLRFCKIKGTNTLEAKNSKIGIASYLKTNQHKMIRFAAFCRELHTSKATRSKNLQIVTNVAQLINVYIC